MHKKLAWILSLFIVLLAISALGFRVQRVEASGAIYILASGEVVGTDKISRFGDLYYEFSDNVNDSIVVERNNIAINGNGWTLDGINHAIMVGFNLTAVTNVTISDVNIQGFASYSIYLESASQCDILKNTVFYSEIGIELSSSTGNTVSNNLITSCSEAIELLSSSGNTLSGNNMSDVSTGIYSFNSTENTISGNSVTHSSRGVFLYGSSNFNEISGNNFTGNEYEGIQLESSSNNNTISENYMSKNDYGVRVEESSGNMISGNNIAANGYSGIRLFSSAYNTIWKNDITNNSLSVRGKSGIGLDMSSNNLLLENNIVANNWWGINPVNLGNNTILGNNVTNNNVGINSASSDFNIVWANNIKDNVYSGVYLESSAHNKFQHNNFVNNTNQVVLELGYTNSWDDGFEGNYWDNYTGVDLNHDGIGDTPHVIDENNTDYHPLIGVFHSFNTSLGKSVNVMSNSNVDSFQYELPSSIRFHVSNMTANQTHGFCRMNIPYEVMSEPYNVTIDGANPIFWNYTLYDNGTHRWIYFEYEHSTKEVIIIPEFPVFTTLPLLITLAALVTLVYLRKHAQPNDLHSFFSKILNVPMTHLNPSIFHKRAISIP